MSQDEKLVYMAGQIATFFAAQGESSAAAAVCQHLSKFWPPAMRQRFLAISARDESLAPVLRQAADLLRQQSQAGNR